MAIANCKFCKIINDKAVRETEEILYEDYDFIVVTDKYRRTSAGAICLIIPKQHVLNLIELPEEKGSILLRTIRMISQAMQKAYDCKGIRIWTAVNKEAGQSIFHCHIHIVPCKSIRDRFIASFPGFYDQIRKIKNFGNPQLNRNLNFELAEKIRKELKVG